jgi:hypothetical protein
LRHEPFRDFVYEAGRIDGSLGIVSASGKPVFDAKAGSPVIAVLWKDLAGGFLIAGALSAFVPPEFWRCA